MTALRTVGVLTYQSPHKKTYDTLSRLKVLGYEGVVVWALPMSYKKKVKPTVSHRPDMQYLVPETKAVCRAFDYLYYEIDDCSRIDFSLDNPILVCGAGILPEVFVQRHKLINSHPGYIPFARGLDALKWAVLEELPIGVTTHLLGDEIDAGKVIERRSVEVRETDSFFELGMRVYETEVEMLVSAIDRCDGPFDIIEGGSHPVHRRMPNELEGEMLKAFEGYKRGRGADYAV